MVDTRKLKIKPRISISPPVWEWMAQKKDEAGWSSVSAMIEAVMAAYCAPQVKPKKK